MQGSCLPIGRYQVIELAGRQFLDGIEVAKYGPWVVEGPWLGGRVKFPNPHQIVADHAKEGGLSIQVRFPLTAKSAIKR